LTIVKEGDAAMNKRGYRVVQIKPVRIGPSSVGLTIPKWWLDLNNSPKALELIVSLDTLTIRPLSQPSDVRKEHGEEKTNLGGRSHEQ
jgi:hypothetical protein